MSAYQYPPGPSGNFPPRQGKKERGGCLTVWLVVVTSINLLFGFVRMVEALRIIGDPRVMNGDYAVAIVLIVALHIALISGLFGIWNWKRWGVYLVAGSLVANAAMNIITGDIMGGIINPLFQFAFFYYVINPKWNDFD